MPVRIRPSGASAFALAGRLGRRRGLQGATGLREGARLRLRRALALLLRGRRNGRRLLGEDRLLRLACDEALELVLVDRLALDEDRRDPVQVVHVLLEDARRAVVSFL